MDAVAGVDQVKDSVLRASRERRPLALWQPALIGLAVLALYAPILYRLVEQWWQDPNYGHGFFVPIFAAYLVWQRREAIRDMTPRPSWIGLPVVILSVGVLYVGSLGAELFLSRISLLGVLAGLVLYFLGWRGLRLLFFPIAVLFFMIPWPAIVYNQIVFPLQLLASRIAASLLQQTRVIPVLLEGNVLVLPNARLEVVEACSGIRSLMSLITLAIIYGYFAEKRVWLRVVLVAAMVPLAVFSNSARVLFTAVMSQVWGPSATEGWIHEMSGVVLFVVATVSMLLLHRLITLFLRFRQREVRA